MTDSIEARLAAAKSIQGLLLDADWTLAELTGALSHDGLAPTLAADLALAAAVRERFPNMTLAVVSLLAIEEDLLAPGDIDPDNGRTVERVTGTAADPVVVYDEAAKEASE